MGGGEDRFFISRERACGFAKSWYLRSHSRRGRGRGGGMGWFDESRKSTGIAGNSRLRMLVTYRRNPPGNEWPKPGIDNCLQNIVNWPYRGYSTNHRVPQSSPGLLPAVVIGLKIRFCTRKFWRGPFSNHRRINFHPQKKKNYIYNWPSLKVRFTHIVHVRGSHGSLHVLDPSSEGQ